MAKGRGEARSLNDPEVRAMFTRESMFASAWYRERLDAKRRADIRLWECHEKYLKQFCSKANHQDVAKQMQLETRFRQTQERIEFLKTDEYRQRLDGTLGADFGSLKPPNGKRAVASASSDLWLPTRWRCRLRAEGLSRVDRVDSCRSKFHVLRYSLLAK